MLGILDLMIMRYNNQTINTQSSRGHIVRGGIAMEVFVQGYVGPHGNL